MSLILHPVNLYFQRGARKFSLRRDGNVSYTKRMTHTDNFHAALIRQLGGVSVVAQAFNVAPGACRKWLLPGRGIPWRRWDDVVKLAKLHGMTITVDDLNRTKWRKQ